MVWIAGGLAKSPPLDSLVAQVRDRLRAVVVMGTATRTCEAALAKHAASIPVKRIGPGETVMRDAVGAARALATPGDTVLFSPACASMDQFRDYADRGEAFAQTVRSLEGR